MSDVRDQGFRRYSAEVDRKAIRDIPAMKRPDRSAPLARAKVVRGEIFDGQQCASCLATFESVGRVPSSGCPACGGRRFKTIKMQRVQTVREWPDGRVEVLQEGISDSPVEP